MCCATIVTAQQKKAYVVSNAHFDSQWNWDVQRSISEYIPKTLDQNLFLLEKYPDYVFNFEGGIKYQWMKEYFPHQYELIKKYIDEGRWHVTGSTWDANDPNIPSPESFTRNILYGQHFYRDEFGVEGTDIFLPDCFGFGWTLPTVAAHSGLIGFSTQKLQWRNKPFYDNNSKIPFEIGLWQGVDGSRIMMVADAHNYTTKWPDEDLSHSKALMNIIDRSPIGTVYHYYGTGDTGGAPTIESVRAVEKGVNGDGPIEIISATSDQLYKDYLPFDAHPELPVFDGELLMDVHATGCYTSQAAMKLFNRRNELLADAAERSAVAADWLGGLDYPKGTLAEAWKRVIWHQFHDDLTGTSLPRAYEFSWNDEIISLKQFANVLTSSAGAVSRELDTRVKGVPLVIFNPLAYPVSDVVEVTVDMPKGARSVSVYDENGRQVPSQMLANDEGRATLLIEASMPSMGYAVYDVRSGGRERSNGALSARGNQIENSVYRVTLDGNGDIASILDKRSGKELVESGKAIRLALFTPNESFRWPAWEIIKSVMDAQPVAITDNVKISVVENGPVRSTICVERSYEGSTFKQYIRLSEGGQKDRIDIHNDIDWQSTNALLKAEFPLSFGSGKAVYDLGVGSVERGNNTETAYEVYAQQWADLTAPDNGYGVSILNDSKYGWDKPADNTLRLTLLHTPATRGGYSYQNKQDFGRHHFTYSIYGHQGDYRAGATVRKAEMLNRPLYAFVAPKHAGSLGRSFSFLGIDNDKVSLKALKQAEKSDEYVLRFYETTGQGAQRATVTFPSAILAAKELNGVEDVIGDVSFSGNKLTFEVRPFGIKTFKVELAAPAKTLEQPLQQTVELKYNTKTSTYNSFRNTANLDGKGHTYAAELLPEEIVWGGVRFELPGGDVPNGIKSRGDTIELPAGNYNKLYLLAASTQYDNLATFTVGGKAQETVVPYYSGFVGQWGHTGHTEAFMKPADIAYVGTHRHTMIGNKDLPYEFTYMFCIGLEIPAGARELVLPDDPRIVIFAATVVSDENNTLVPASDLLGVNLPLKLEDDAATIARRNLLLGKRVIEKSGEVNRSERGEMALDDEITTKWCDNSIAKPKYIVVDMGKEYQINGWSVLHAGMEALDWITKEYSLEVKLNPGDQWKTVDTVYDNTALETDRLLPEPVKARYVKLSIAKPDQSEGIAARIYEFRVY